MTLIDHPSQVPERYDFASFSRQETTAFSREFDRAKETDGE
jgi:hypothetical protein